MNFFLMLMAAALVCFIGVFVYAIRTETNNVAPTSMVTPFGNSSGKAIVSASAGESGKLSVANLGASEIGQKMVDIIAESLTFNKQSLNANTTAVQKYFTQSGYEQYRQFLDTSGIIQTVSTQDLQSGVYAEQNPMELNKGVAGGAYKWYFEVPVTISFTPRGAETYRNGETTAQNRRVLLRLQFTRVNDPQDPDAVRIEIWQALAARK